MNDLVSIISPAYNVSQFVADTIMSVIAQTYQNWEMIIIDDCSTDETIRAISYFNDKRIRLIKNEKNSGAASSRNHALREARGKWIAFLDCDDLWEPTKLEKQIRFMEENDYHFSYTKYAEVNNEGQPTGRMWTGPKKISKPLMYTFNYMGCLTVMYDAEYIGLIQIKEIKKRNDYAIWIKAVHKCPAYLLNENLAFYRIRSQGSLTDRKKSVFSRLKYNYWLWRDSEGMGVIASAFLFAVNFVFAVAKKTIFCRNIRNPR